MNDQDMKPTEQETPEQEEYIEEIDVDETGVSGGGWYQPPPSKHP